jgi:hypothetical protein
MFKTGTSRFFDSPSYASVTLSMVFLQLTEGNLLVCICLVSGWHKLWAFVNFLGDDDITPDFRGFPIPHEKQTVNCR